MLDTNVLLGSLEAIESLADDIEKSGSAIVLMIPGIVVEELDLWVPLLGFGKELAHHHHHSARKSHQIACCYGKQEGHLPGFFAN